MRMLVLTSTILVVMMQKSYGQDLTSQNLVSNILNNAKYIEQMESNLGSYRCKHTVTTSAISNGRLANKTLSKVEYRVAHVDDMLMVSIPQKKAQNGKPIRPESRSIYNSGDMFAVSRPSDDQAWIISEFKRDVEVQHYLELLGISKTVLVPLTFTGLGGSIEEIVTHPKFRFADIRKRKDGQIITQFIVDDFGKGKFHMEGTMTFSANKKYILTEYDIMLKFADMQRKLKLHRVMDPNSKDLHCTSLNFIGRKPHKQNQPEPKGAETTTLIINDYQDINKDEFTLDYYKVPEPTDIDALPPPFYSGWKFWAIVAAVCLIGTFVARYLARRYASS